jgi:hypothetical protein
VYERSKEEVEGLCLRAGEDALVEVGIADLHPELLTVLGRLRYRTSYGPERAQAPGRDGPHRRAHGRRAGPGAGADQARARSCTTSARRSPTRSRAATRCRRGAGPQVRGERGRRARHRGAPQRGRAAYGRGRPDPGADSCSGGRPGHAGRAWSPTSSGCSGSRRSPPASPASSGSSRCRPVARSGSWCSRRRWTT